MAPNSNALPSTRHIQRKRKYHSDEGDFSDDDSGFSPKSASLSPDDDRRAHHNELERRRRDHIKDHFSNLKNAIPLLEGEKSSRALILKRAVDYIQVLQAQLKESKIEIEDQKRRNDQLRNHATTTMSFINQSNLSLPPPPPPQQPQSHSAFSLPSTASSAFSCINLPSTSVVHHQQQPSAFTSVTDCLPSSPLAATTGATSYVPNYPSINASEQAAKTALLSSLLLQNLGHLIQSPLAAPSTNTITSVASLTNDFNNSQLFALREHQLAVGQL